MNREWESLGGTARKIRRELSVYGGRSMKLTRSRAERQERIRAFDRDQLSLFLAAAEQRAPRLYPLFFVLARTGIRLGEALALRWEDLDLVTKLRRGAACPRAFPGMNGEPMPHGTAQKGFERARKAAGLPGHHTPHSLRHTYASLLLQDGVSPAYVQEQLGHASIELTVGTYGRWLRKRAPGAVDRLDSEQVVAEQAEVVAAAAGADAWRPTIEAPKVLTPWKVAEREGFEPSEPGSPVHVISSHADSTTLASLRR